jgi:hypothetical protein
MQAKAGQIHIFDRWSGVQRCQQIANAIDHILRQFSTIIVFKEPLQSLVPEAGDHCECM